MIYKLFCWRCRAKVETNVYVSIFICEHCLGAPMRKRAAEDRRLAAYLESLRRKEGQPCES